MEQLRTLSRTSLTASNSHLEHVRIDNVPIIRLTVVPATVSPAARHSLAFAVQIPASSASTQSPAATPQSLDPSYAVVATDLKWSLLSSRTEEEVPFQQAKTTLPFSLHWQQAMPARWDINFELPENVICMGLGERYSNLNLRGKKHTLCATPVCPHIESTDALYAVIPFLILAHPHDIPNVQGTQSMHSVQGTPHIQNIQGTQSQSSRLQNSQNTQYTGLFLDSPAPQRWDLDSESIAQGKIELFTRLGWQLYMIGPTTLPALINTYTTLTGRTELPPRWSLGHHQSRYSYPEEQTVQYIAHEFRSRKIPCDTIVLDIDYMDGYRVFTYSKDAFPHFEQMIADLSKAGFKLVPIVDPGVKQDPQYATYKEGVAQGHFCTTGSGELFTEQVWPGTCVFPDFLQAKTKQWWANQLRFLLDKGVGGIWNDMNEPEFFNKKQVLPDNMVELPEPQDQLFLQQSGNGPVGHFEVRNLYGSLMAAATKNGLLAARSDERPFILTRSGYAGIQRYAVVWTGDNSSWFRHLAYSIPMLINLGLSGVPFVGVDVGGHLGDATPELLIRWYETGIFYPFFRNHCVKGARAQEPFAYGAKVEQKIRKLIEFRYRLLPYIQNLFWEHMRTGAPLMRPLSWHYPDDETARRIYDQFLFGADILVAPIIEEGQKQRFVYLPKGKWHLLNSGSVYGRDGGKVFKGGKGVGENASENSRSAGRNIFEGGKVHTVTWELGSIPAFAREGSIIPMIDVIQSTAEYNNANISFNVFGDEAEGVLLEDDGRSFAYNQGGYNEWRVVFRSGKLNASAIHKGYESARREFFVYHNCTRTKVRLG